MTDVGVVTDEDLAAPPAVAHAPRARLGRYALWQLRDFAYQRAAAMLAIALALAVPAIATTHAARKIVTYGPNGSMTYQTYTPNPAQAASNSLAAVLIPVILVGAVLAIRGLVSDDRQHGYYRFAFAKPVNITRYYAQSYAVQFAGFLGVVALLIALFALFLRPVHEMPAMLAAAAVYFTLVGGVGFLLSTLVRAEWFWLIATFGVTGAVNAAHELGTRWVAPLVAVLPPVRAFGRVVESLLIREYPMSWGSLAWVLAYGLACTAAGLLVIRRRAFA